MTELLGVQSAASGEGADDGGVLVQFLLGDCCLDDGEAVFAVHAEDFTTSAGKVTYDVAHAVFGDFDFHVTDGFEEARAGGFDGFAEAFLAGDLECDVLGVDGVGFAVVEVDFDIGDAVACEDAFAAGGLDTFFD
ncbi:MAG: hypothetical protein RI897_2482 [Verrucomicrobiota bacterium]